MDTIERGKAWKIKSWIIRVRIHSFSIHKKIVIVLNEESQSSKCVYKLCSGFTCQTVLNEESQSSKYEREQNIFIGAGARLNKNYIFTRFRSGFFFFFFCQKYLYKNIINKQIWIKIVKLYNIVVYFYKKEI